MAQHLIEDLDLFFAEPLAVDQIETRDPPERFNALLARAVGDGILEIGNQ